MYFIVLELVVIVVITIFTLCQQLKRFSCSIIYWLTCYDEIAELGGIVIDMFCKKFFSYGGRKTILTGAKINTHGGRTSWELS